MYKFLIGPGGNGPGGGFKNNLIMGPGGPGPHSHPTPASDPNYAQQFHNFQQQLYATNTRNNQMGQNNGPPPGAVGSQGKQDEVESRFTVISPKSTALPVVAIVKRSITLI